MCRIMMGLSAALLMVVSSFANAEEPRANAQAQDVRGRIVRVDPTKNVIVVRTGEGDQAKEMEYQVNDTTKYWGNDRKAVDNGLRFNGFKEGTDVWYRMGTGNNARTISEMRFFDPTRANPNPK